MKIFQGSFGITARVLLVDSRSWLCLAAGLGSLKLRYYVFFFGVIVGKLLWRLLRVCF